jgi:hypothetical protein
MPITTYPVINKTHSSQYDDVVIDDSINSTNDTDESTE